MVKQQGWDFHTVAPGTVVTNTFGGSVTPGNLVVVLIQNNFTSVADNQYTVTDNKGGNTWVEAIGTDPLGGYQFGVHIYYSLIVNGGSSFQVTVTSDNSGFFDCEFAEFSGNAPSNVVDITARNVGTSTTASTGTINTTSSGLVVAKETNNQNTTASVSGGWTEIIEDLGGEGDYRIEIAPGSFQADWTLGINSQWFTAIAAFKDAPGVPSALPFITTVDAKRF